MDVKFPAIEISESLGFFVVNKLADSCNALGWRNGYFRGLAYLDSDGYWWPVVEAKLPKPISALDRVLNRNLKVSLKLGDPVPDGVALAKTRMIKMLDLDPDDIYDQFLTHEELKKHIMDAKGPSELIEITNNLWMR